MAGEHMSLAWWLKLGVAHETPAMWADHRRMRIKVRVVSVRQGQPTAP